MAQLSTQSSPQGLNEDGRRRLVQVFAMVAIYALFLFIPAGTLRWWNAWGYEAYAAQTRYRLVPGVW